MQDNYRDPAASSSSDDDFIDSEDENTDAEYSLNETHFHQVMTQREMEILTTLFPKAARAVARVLSNRPE